MTTSTSESVIYWMYLFHTVIIHILSTCDNDAICILYDPFKRPNRPRATVYGLYINETDGIVWCSTAPIQHHADTYAGSLFFTIYALHFTITLKINDNRIVDFLHLPVYTQLLILYQSFGHNTIRSTRLIHIVFTNIKYLTSVTDFQCNSFAQTL